MATDNTVTLMGKLTDDPELRFTTNGAAVTNFRLPSPPRVHQGDQWTDGETRFFHITCWRQLADKVTETLGKGARAIVIGRLRLRSWETDDFGPDGQIGGLEAAGHLGQDPAGASIQPQDLPIGGQQPHALPGRPGCDWPAWWWHAADRCQWRCRRGAAVHRRSRPTGSGRPGPERSVRATGSGRAACRWRRRCAEPRPLLGGQPRPARPPRRGPPG